MQNAPDSILPLIERQINQARRRRQTGLQRQLRLLNNMSNSILSNLHAIMGFSELLAENELSAEQHEYVQSIYEAGNTVVLRINNVLEYLKIKQGKTPLKIQDVSLDLLLKEIDAVMRPRANKKALEFNIISPGRLPADVRTDASLLRQLLMQLAEYAIKTTKIGRVGIKVTLETVVGETFIRFDFEGGESNLNVEKKKAACHPFTETAENARLFDDDALWDLIIADQLAKLLGGGLSVVGTPEQDSIFSISIPAGAYSREHSPGDNPEMIKQDQRLEEKEIDKLLFYITETYGRIHGSRSAAAKGKPG
ncbi:MAG: hypothetical protein AMJ79_02145 [Phycisphaerae bacterium SM23_30]|nr:MAG: hypothetical protein AMJ79_02145 [Phycisphaerae bacterium SM23_30]